MQDMLREAVIGVISFVVVYEVLQAVDLGEGTGASLIELLVPLAIAIVVTLALFRRLDRGGGRRPR